MIVFPNAKINLGLNVLAKRADGFHTIESVFLPVNWCDVLEVIPDTELVSKEKPAFHISGIETGGNNSDNLVLKAIGLLKERFELPEFYIHLHKNIPAGAGLGGGSADAAFTLSSLNKHFNLGLSIDELVALASKLGSDCAFFLHNKPMYLLGKGHELQPLEFELPKFYLALVHPGIGVSTAMAYGGIKPKPADYNLLEILKQPLANWKEFVRNDFEQVVFNKLPEVESIKQKLYEVGAEFALMSGSGSCVYGLFTEKPALDLKAQFPKAHTWLGETL